MVFTENSSDEELMQAYQDGVDGAFDMLYSRYSSKVYGYLINRLKNSSWADDVLQATFLKLHISRAQYRKSLPFAPWLFTICKTALIDTARKRARTKEESNSEAVDLAVAPPAHFESSPKVVNPYIEKLSERERSAVQMRYSDDLPFEEIARRLETTPANARQILSRAVRSLKTLARKT